LGGSSLALGDRLVAVAGILRSSTDEDRDLTTTVESAVDGWWYTARIPNRKRIVIYFTDGDLLKRYGANNDAMWLRLASRTQFIKQLSRIMIIL
jgi:hypothetical protein